MVLKCKLQRRENDFLKAVHCPVKNRVMCVLCVCPLIYDFQSDFRCATEYVDSPSKTGWYS